MAYTIIYSQLGLYSLFIWFTIGTSKSLCHRIEPVTNWHCFQATSKIHETRVADVLPGFKAFCEMLTWHEYMGCVVV